jgi:hypothetical protein
MSKKRKPARKSATANASRPKTAADVFAGHPVAVRRVALQLRKLVIETLPDATETPVGGAKVRLTLFSLGSSGKTICGVQPGAHGCLLYLHHIAPEDSSLLKIGGKGKHARQIKVETLDQPMVDEIRRLLLLAHGRMNS